MSHTLFATHSGKLFDNSNMKPEDVCLEDISHHLCNINRFGGCLPLSIRYSVASHSLNCFKMALKLFPGETEVWRTALMHDATEAYLGDVVSGLKSCLSDYKHIETTLWHIIKEKYQLQEFSRVGEIDKRIMLDEAKSLLPKNYDIYLKHQSYAAYNAIEIVPDKYPEMIKFMFLKTCGEIGIHD